MYTYEIVQSDSGTPAVVIKRDNGEVILYQTVNPQTGQPFANETEATQYAEQIVGELNLQEMTTNPPKLSVSFLDVDTGEPKKLIEVGKPVNVNIELYYEVQDEDGNTTKQYAPVTGDYIVPYYSDDVQAGSVLIHIENGKGSGQLTFNKTGIFEIKLDKVLNAETMSQPNPLPILDENPRIAVVETLTQTS